MNIKAGEDMFSVNQGSRRAHFLAPLSGKVTQINQNLQADCSKLGDMPYGRNWICIISPDDLAAELPLLKIGRSAATMFEEDIGRFTAHMQKVSDGEGSDSGPLYIGAIEQLDDARWESTVKEFFGT